MALGGQIDTYEPGPQSGGRKPAPGRLGLVQAFVNSHYDLEFERGADLLADPAALRAWLARRGLVTADARVTDEQFECALALREGLRAMLLHNNGAALDADAVARFDAATARLPLVLRAVGTPELTPYGTGADAGLAHIVGVAAHAMLDGSWTRFKACHPHDCRWAFYDHSRNGSSAWCSMRVCGGRAKQRAYYRRTR